MKRLSPEEEAIQSFEALERLLLSNLRLVILAARRYQYYGFEIEDLWQISSLSLRYALARFDDSKKHGIVTYAKRLIRLAVLRTLIRRMIKRGFPRG